jgi:xanthine dehydrogenase YagT iron-sulfur-binding subunit
MPEEHKDNHEGERAESTGLSRREFLKGTGLAVSAGVLVGEGLLGVAAAERPAVVGPGPVPVTLRVNGQVHRLELEPRVTLLDALRNHLHLTGAKKVCDRGTCGACTVIVGGRPVYACTLLAIAAQGEPIETIEGLAPEGKLHPLSQAFVDNDAQQCGFCTPGFVMAAKAYLDRHPHPTEEEVRRALNGNICRCGTYMGVRRAVVEAALKRKGGQG